VVDYSNIVYRPSSHQVMSYGAVNIAGGDTATPLNLAKRLRLIGEKVGFEQRRILDCGCGAGE